MIVELRNHLVQSLLWYKCGWKEMSK